MKKVSLFIFMILLTIALSGCVKQIENDECVAKQNCEEGLTQAILVVEKRNDYYKLQHGYYSYKFNVVGKNKLFEYEGSTWFDLSIKWEEGQKIFVIKNNDELWFSPLL